MHGVAQPRLTSPSITAFAPGGFEVTHTSCGFAAGMRTVSRISWSVSPSGAGTTGLGFASIWFAASTGAGTAAVVFPGGADVSAEGAELSGLESVVPASLAAAAFASADPGESG